VQTSAQAERTVHNTQSATLTQVSGAISWLHDNYHVIALFRNTKVKTILGYVSTLPNPND